jgi:hypothetical protein
MPGNGVTWGEASAPVVSMKTWRWAFGESLAVVVVEVVEDMVNTSSVLDVEVVPRMVRLFVDAKAGVDVELVVDEGREEKDIIRF